MWAKAKHTMGGKAPSFNSYRLYYKGMVKVGQGGNAPYTAIVLYTSVDVVPRSTYCSGCIQRGEKAHKKSNKLLPQNHCESGNPLASVRELAHLNKDTTYN
jgi:hypothetical protein